MDKDNAIKADIFNMTAQHPDEPLYAVVPDAISSMQFCQAPKPAEDPAFLPFPLQCMNRKEKIGWVTREMLREQQRMTNKPITKIKYGDPALRQTFWIEDNWNWVKLDRNLSNVNNKMYTGPGEFQDFITRLIER